jgi:hypothetical protein
MEPGWPVAASVPVISENPSMVEGSVLQHEDKNVFGHRRLRQQVHHPFSRTCRSAAYASWAISSINVMIDNVWLLEGGVWNRSGVI